MKFIEKRNDENSNKLVNDREYNKTPRAISYENTDKITYNPKKTFSNNDLSNKFSLEKVNKLKY